jgi:hypothetical protein
MSDRYSPKPAQRSSNLGSLWESSFSLSLITRKPTPKGCKTWKAKAALLLLREEAFAEAVARLTSNRKSQ